MRFTLRLFGLTLLSLDVEELVYDGGESVTLGTDTERDDDDDEELPFGFAQPVEA